MQGVLQNKVVQQQENEINPQMCHAKTLDKYFDGLPEGAKAKHALNLTSLPKKLVEPGEPW